MKGKKERRRNNAKFSGHYVCTRVHNVRAHALLSHQFNLMIKSRGFQYLAVEGCEIEVVPMCGTFEGVKVGKRVWFFSGQRELYDHEH